MDDVYAFCRKMMEISPEVLGLAKLTIDMYTDVQDRTVQRHIDRLAVTLTFEEFAKGAQREVPKKRGQGGLTGPERRRQPLGPHRPMSSDPELTAFMARMMPFTTLLGLEALAADPGEVRSASGVGSGPLHLLRRAPWRHPHGPGRLGGGLVRLSQRPTGGGHHDDRIEDQLHSGRSIGARRCRGHSPATSRADHDRGGIGVAGPRRQVGGQGHPDPRRSSMLPPRLIPPALGSLSRRLRWGRAGGARRGEGPAPWCRSGGRKMERRHVHRRRQTEGPRRRRRGAHHRAAGHGPRLQRVRGATGCRRAAPLWKRWPSASPT